MSEPEQNVEYEPPEIVDFGDLVELTAGQLHGHYLDAAFVAGPHADHLSISD